jgi:hypothetical protein
VRIAFGALLGKEVGMAILQVRTRTNGDVTLPEDTIRKFKESLRGELILANEPGYDDARSVWNAMIGPRSSRAAWASPTSLQPLTLRANMASHYPLKAAVITFQDLPCARED